MSSSGYPADFHKSPEPLPSPRTAAVREEEDSFQQQPLQLDHQFHLLQQIREDQVSIGGVAKNKDPTKDTYFEPYYTLSKLVYHLSRHIFQPEEYAVATWMGFWGLLAVTCANFVLSPMRDAAALQVGVQHIPRLTLASSLLAFLSSVPIGWLFEAPDPKRRKVWKTMGLTRGETQGTSLALFYRCFALCVLCYAVGFKAVDSSWSWIPQWLRISFQYTTTAEEKSANDIVSVVLTWIQTMLGQLGQLMYIAFFLVIHLMKLHSLSLIWGVASEAMEYEDVARKKGKEMALRRPSSRDIPSPIDKSSTRLQRLALLSFGGTLGGILGSLLASSMAGYVNISGLLLVSAVLLELSAQLSIELGRIMQKHWEEQQVFLNRASCQDLANLDSSMKRSVSVGSMKRVASGNSLHTGQQPINMKRAESGNSLVLSSRPSQNSLSGEASSESSKPGVDNTNTTQQQQQPVDPLDENTFTQRLLRGVSTILSSRLLMSIFTYNALHASTSVLLSFQRAELVAGRNSSTTVSADTAFLANINMASSVAIFIMQASGVGAYIAQLCGSSGSLTLMPLMRLVAVLSLAWWHKASGGQPPNLILFLMLDECTRIVNLAVAKPVREGLWRGLSNEARYEAKPIVDTLANRWGGGSAAFSVSIINKILIWAGVTTMHADRIQPSIFGFQPVLFLCLTFSLWWAAVSADLGHIRRSIDLELKKHQ